MTMRKNLRKALQREERQNVKETDQNSKLWKGKKMVSEKEWRRILQGPHSLFLEYIPESFMSIPILKPIDYHKISREKIQEWGQDYYSFLEHTKNPEYGNRRCEKCILNPDSKVRPSMRDITLKAYPGDPGQRHVFPCTVVDIFKCPYAEKDGLLFAGKTWEIIHEALEYAFITTQQSEDLFHVDFQARLVGWSPPYDLTNPIDELDELRIPRVPVRRVDDTCKVLTHRSLLETLIDQYIEALDDGNFDKVSISRSFIELEWIRETKDLMIEFILGMKENMTPEGLQNRLGRAFLHDPKSDPIREKPQVISEKCSLCDNSANILCVNCDHWCCIDHWRQHGLEVHNYQLK